MYLAWLDPTSTRAEVSEVMMGRVAPKLLDLEPRGLSIDVWDPESDIPAPVPTPEGETPLHTLISVWIDAVDYRSPYEEVLGSEASRLAGYEVVESLYRDYGGNRWSEPRHWPDGTRSPGVLTVALLQQHPDQSLDGVDDEVAHPDLSHHRVDPAAVSLRSERGLPCHHRRGAAPAGHGRGGMAVPRACHRPHAVLLWRR